MTTGRWYRKLPWRRAAPGDVVLVHFGATAHNGHVRQVHSVGMSRYAEQEFVWYTAGDAAEHTNGTYNQSDRFDQLEATSMTDPDWPGKEAGYVWGSDFAPGHTTEGGNTNTVGYRMEGSWHKVVPGDVVVGNYNTGEAFLDEVMVVTEAGSDNYVTLVSFKNPSLRTEIHNTSFYTLEKDTSGPGRFEGPNDATIASMVGSHNYATGGDNMQNPLTIKTAKIVKVLKDALKSQKNAWDEAEQAKADKVAGAATIAAEFISKYPGLAKHAVMYMTGIKFDGVSTLEEAEDYMKNSGREKDLTAHEKTETYDVLEFPGNGNIEKLIRTLELAEDETIEVSPTDEIYPLI